MPDEETKPARYPCACGCGRVADEVIVGYSEDPECGVQDLKGAPFSDECLESDPSASYEEKVRALGKRIRANEAKKSQGTDSYGEEIAKFIRIAQLACKPEDVDERSSLMTSTALAVGRMTGRMTDDSQRISELCALCIARLEHVLHTTEVDVDELVVKARERLRSVIQKEWLENNRTAEK
jgi:hypothetical protein